MTEKQEMWITSEEASQILTANSGHAVSDSYVRRLAMNGKLSSKMIGKKTRLFNRAEVENTSVRQRGVKVINPSTVMMQCQVCGQQWSPNLTKGGRLPANAMQCPNGCTLEIEVKSEEQPSAA